jgi:hypothetical protein
VLALDGSTGASVCRCLSVCMWVHTKQRATQQSTAFLICQCCHYVYCRLWWGRLTALRANVSPFLNWCTECFAACVVFFPFSLPLHLQARSLKAKHSAAIAVLQHLEGTQATLLASLEGQYKIRGIPTSSKIPLPHANWNAIEGVHTVSININHPHLSMQRYISEVLVINFASTVN